MYRCYLKVLLLCGIGFAFGIPGSAGASDLSTAMDTFAKQLASVLRDDFKTSEVTVGQFVGSPTQNISTGPSIVLALREGLGKHGIEVKRRAAYGVGGEILVAKDHVGRVAARIKGTIYNGAHKTELKFDELITDPAAVAAIFGATVEIPASHSAAKHSKTLHQAILNPKTNVQHHKVSPSKNNPFAVEVVVRDHAGKSKPRQVVEEDGFAYVELRHGEEYGIQVTNGSTDEVAVTVTIDGINNFQFGDNQKLKHFVIAAHQTLLVPGWYRSRTRSDAFRITEYPDSAAAKLNATAEQCGTITVAFSLTQDPTHDRYSKRGFRGKATGFGRQVTTDFREVHRVIGQLVNSVSIRYDKY